MVRLLLATGNAGKVEELRALLAGEAVELRSLADYPGAPDVTEDGASFRENARKKALHYAQATQLPALADDSGLEVDALEGAPGVHSARYAGAQRNDKRNNALLLRVLEGVPDEARTARFRCCMALAEGGAIVLEASGAVEGRIATDLRGEGGFGYDPLFEVTAMGRRMAELPADEKNAVSHRGKALRGLLPGLKAWLHERGGH